MRLLPILAVLLAWAGNARAAGLVIPDDRKLPPLAMLNHKVTIAIEDQVAVTRVEQTFRNHTQRPLEATYVFPVPKGASVNKFSMWVGDKEVKGELVEADKARAVYNSIVRRTQDPGLLEYLGQDLFRMRAFPVPAGGDQKVALSYTSVGVREGSLVEYVYPLKTDGKATATLEDLSIRATVKSQHGVQNVYSPTHAITLQRKGDKEVAVRFDKEQGLLDRDFQLFYQLGDKDVGLTALAHRPVAKEHGYFLLLATPRVELSPSQQVPRDVVFVLDTSGSMRADGKMEQARKALKHCLGSLSKADRFGLVAFATTVNPYRDGLAPADTDQVDQAKKWVDELEPTGGTAIYDALEAALAMRPQGEGRTFTVVFFTDGMPTIGEGDKIKPEAILKNTVAKNTANTRIFTFGVGDDVNATLLDQLAEKTRALSAYVRPQEDIEAKVSSLYGKISRPVLTNLKLTTTADVRLLEVYPPQLPDLFYGGQLAVLGRYSGKGPSAIKLTGAVGKEQKEFVYEMTFPERTGEREGRDFVEHLWARRKVGYLLDQIRASGENKELVAEVIALAKRYGITTPYTSHLIVPDGAVPVVPASPGKERPNVRFNLDGKGDPAALAPPRAGGARMRVEDFARRSNTSPDELAKTRGGWEGKKFTELEKRGDKNSPMSEAKGKWDAYNQARELLRQQQHTRTQAGKLGVDLSVQTDNLRNQSRLEFAALRQVQGRNVMEVGGVWIDEGFTAKTKAVVVKAQSDAYFRILERKPQVKDVFRLGNHLVWVTPSGTALIIDAEDGKDKLDDKEIDKLFSSK